MRGFQYNFIFIGLLVVALPASGEVEQTELEALQKKCMVELRYQFVPKNCYSWIENAPLRSERKKYLQNWFNSVCKKALHKNDTHVQYHVQNLSSLSKDCQSHLEVAFSQWSYKAKAETPEKLVELLALKTGKELEYSHSHDQKKTRRNRNTRGPWGRLN